MFDTSKMPDEAKAMCDGIRVTIKLARWAYLAALEEGFTEAQSMQVANALIEALESSKEFPENGLKEIVAYLSVYNRYAENRKK